jgi:peroxiredoxin
MRLQRELDNFRAEFERTAPAGRAALYEAKVEELRQTFPREQIPTVGDEAQDFILPDALGRSVSLYASLQAGPVVVTFYRGGWCPYCNIQLLAYQRVLPQIADLGGKLLSISPQQPDASLSTVEKNALKFNVLSDAGNAVARTYGLVYALPDEIRDALRASGKALPGFNGDDSWELPLTATFVIGRDGRIVLAWADTDYRKRLEPEAIVEALGKLRYADAQRSRHPSPA